MQVGDGEPFQVQTSLSLRLTRNSRTLLLHNVETGEVCTVEESQDWSKVTLTCSDDTGPVLQHVDQSGSQSVTSVFHWLQLQKDEDDLIDLADDSRTAWSDAVKVTVPLALSLKKSQSVFTCELQAHKCPNRSCCCIFWHIRWLVDWLGGHQSSNFIGQGAKSWATKLAAYLVFVVDGLDEEEELQQTCRSHFLESGNSKLRQSPREGEAPTGNIQMTEYSGSTFAILVMLAHWSARGTHKRSQWKLDAGQVQSRAVSLVMLLIDTFVAADLAMEIAGIKVILLRRDAEVFLDWPAFCSVAKTKLLLRVFGPDDSEVPLHEALLRLCQEEINTRCSQNRRRAATLGLAVVTWALMLVIEGSKQDPIWQQTELWQLQPLRTARQYRRISGQMKAAVVGRTQQCHLRSVSTVLAGMPGSSGKQRGSDYVHHERYSYLQEAKQIFSAGDSISLTIDGVQLGDPILNLIAWDCKTKQGFICPPQVTRPVNAVTGLQQGPEALAGQTEKFMNPPLAGEQPDAKRRRLNGKTKPSVPRLPTLHWIHDVRHCLEQLGRPLREFVAMEDSIPEDAPPALLTLCTDQEALQIAATNFMKWHLNLMCEHVYDPQHRRSNDATLGLAESGLLASCSMSLNLFNIKFGPYLKGGWHTLIKETAEKISRDLSPNDPVLKYYMPSILLDNDEPWHANTESRRAQFLRDLPTQAFVTSKGAKASLSRFNSVTQAALFVEKHWSAQTFLFTMTCLLQGWVAYADQLWDPDPCQSGSQGSGLAFGSGHGTSSAGASASKGTSKQDAKNEAKEVLEKMRGKSVNTFHAMTRYLNDPESKCFCRILAFLQEPEAEASGLMLHRLRGEVATREQYAAWADRSFLEELKAMVLVLKDQRKLRRIGFNMSLLMSGINQDEVAIDNSTASTVFSCMRSLLKFRCGSMLWHTWSLPGLSAILLKAEEEKVERGLQLLKRIYEATEAASTDGSLATKQLLHGQGSSSPAMRWTLRALAKEDFQHVPPHVQHFLLDLWSSLLNSKSVEDLQKLQREHETRTASSKHISKMEAWRVGTQHSLLKSYDRKEISATNFVFLPVGFDETALFHAPLKASSDDTQAELDFCKKLKEVTGQATWPTFSPESQQQIFANLALLDYIHSGDGDWSKVETAYRASFLPEGHCVSMGGSLYYVIRVYDHAALCWPAASSSLGISLNMQISELQWLFVFDVNNVKAVRLEAMSPLYMFQKFKKANCGITMMGQPASSLLDFHMQDGFAGLREVALRRFMKDLGIPEPSSCGQDVPDEISLATNIMLNVNPLLTEKEVVTKMVSRQKSPVSAVFGAEECLDEMVKDTVLGGEVDKVLSHVKAVSAAASAEKVEKKIKAATKAFWTVKETIPMEKLKEAKAKEKAKKEPAASSAAGPKEQKRTYDTLKEHVDKAVRQNAPEKVKVFTDEANGRWKICWEKTSFKQKSISWTAVGAVAAARAAVAQAWEWSREETGCDMPAQVKEKMAKLSA